MRKQLTLSLVIAIFLLSPELSSLAATASFQGLGDLTGGSFSSRASDISADGSVVVGRSQSASNIRAFRWTQTGGMVELTSGSSYSAASGVSADGTVVVGSDYSVSGEGAFRWTETGGMVGLGDMELALGISADGLVVVGSVYDPSIFRSRRWETGAMTEPCTGESDAFAASADGSVVVGVNGYVLGGVTQGKGFRWTALGGLEDLPAAAYGVSDDGSVIVGEGYYWSQSGGIQTLDGTAYGVSADGLVAVGQNNSGTAFVWDQINGMRDIKEILENDCGLDLTGWTLSQANAVANDGLTIVGYGTNPDGYTEAWMATIPEPATAYILALGSLGLWRKRKTEKQRKSSNKEN